VLCCAPARAAERLLHTYGSVSIAPDGSRVVAIESDEPAIEGTPAREQLVIRQLDGSPAKTVALPCDPDPDCKPSQPVWSPDSASVVFILHVPKAQTRALYRVGASGAGLQKVLDFDGVLNDPRFSPAGALAILATAGAHKEIGATQAGAPIVGEIGMSADEQRIAIVGANGALHWASPPDLFVYEYDWKPNAGGFVGTAARGNGDNNWWIAHLYAFDAGNGAATDIYAPSSAQQQIASPRVSPDGSSVAFIGGIMSDFGSTGGDVYVVPVTGGAAVDATPQMKASATALWWRCGTVPQLSFTALEGARYGIHRITAPTSGQAPEHLTYSFGETIDSDVTIACKSPESATAFVRQSFEQPPEIFVGNELDGDSHTVVRPLTHANSGVESSTIAKNIGWKNEGYDVQGWLLAPLGSDATVKHPMITYIHGGPSAANVPRFVGRGVLRDLLRRGYYLFLPNPRGSFGQGEAFTAANVRDFGYGDLRDDLVGIDTVEVRTGAIDDTRLGITGGSYGGFMTMWAVTQTNRFKAAVAGAGLSDWISYYGQNGIDEWMIPFFGASAYDDPAVYRKSSPIEFIKNARTPTFEFVGERDVECPAPQSLEFWHALETLGVPTQLVIYPGEGHRLRTPAHIADVAHRTVAWFDTYLK
jgi:dipeptidyl aminopeptidase/acylaminoacyl peptidase